MTGSVFKKVGKVASTVTPYAMLALSIFLLLLHSSELADFARYGMKLAAFSVIPVVFPFLILSDYLSTSDIGSSGVASKIFSKITGLSPKSIPAFICGNICGFPTGARCAANLYQCGSISRNECERVIGVSSNPSLAFVVSGVGAGMCGSVRIGILLYLILLTSSVAVANIFRSKSENFSNSQYITRQKFDFVASIKNAGINSLSVSSYIVFFSVILGALKIFLKNKYLVTLFSIFLEVGNAASNISSSYNIGDAFALSLLGFALGFSGFCVHFQSFEFMPRELSRKKYLLMKLTEGAIAALLCFVISITV